MDIRELIGVLGTAEKLKDNTRHSWTSSDRHESVAEHSWRACVMAYFLKDEFPEADMGRVMLMCLFHDMGEAFTGDIPAFNKTDKDVREESRQIENWLNSLPEPYRGELKGLFDEMNALSTQEARIYKAVDKLEALIQHNEGPLCRWLPNEYELQLTYGAEAVTFSDYMTRLRKAVNEDSRKKMAEEKCAEAE